MVGMRIIGVIPSRWGSTRFPGKSLAPICGKPLVTWVVEACLKAKSLTEVVVATDDERIAKVVEGTGARAVMTRPDHPSGTDRVAEAAQAADEDIVVNIQGDEPLILPEIIEEITQALIDSPDYPMATGCYRLPGDADLFRNENVVKVVFDKDGSALYFSRSPIPFPRKGDSFAAYEHIGIYAYRKDFLMRYITLPETHLSRTESLEQLRALEHGYRIKVAPTRFAYNALSVDTQEDLDAVTAILKERKEKEVDSP